MFFSIFRPHLNSACATFRRVNLHLRNDIRQIYNWGSLRSPHTCGLNENLSIYLFHLYIYIWYVRIPYIYIYTSCPICARCNISTLQVGSCNHCCSRDKTSRTERLNSVNQCNRNLKTVRKGGTTTKTEADY